MYSFSDRKMDRFTLEINDPKLNQDYKDQKYPMVN